MFYFRRYFFLFFFFLLSHKLLSQSQVLENYIKEGLENNQALKQENFSLQKSIAALEESKALFLPSVSFLANYTLAGGGRTINFPVGDLLNPVYSTLNQMSGSNQFPTISNETIQFLPNDFHETKIRVIQPLFNSDIYFNYKAKRELISVQEAQKNTYQKELVKNIKTSYYQYLQVLSVLDIYGKTESLLNEVLRVNKKLVANDKATSEVVYGAEFEISKLQRDIAEADKNKQVTQSYFNFLLNRSLDAGIQTDTTVLLQEAKAEDLANLEIQAIAQRDELRQVKSGINANNIQQELNKYNKYPKLNAVGDVGYQGFGYKFNNEQDFWLVQFSLQWDLFKGKQNKRKIEQAQIEQSRLTTRYDELQKQIRLQIQKTYYELQANQKAIEASQAGLRSAEKNFYLTKKKYEQGQARYVELVETQTKYTNAQITLVIDRYNYLIKKAELDRLAGE